MFCQKVLTSVEKRKITMLKRYGSLGTCSALSPDKLKQWKSNLSKASLKMWKKSGHRENISLKVSKSLIGHIVSKDTRKKLSENNGCQNDIVKKKISISVKKLWKDPEYIKKTLNKGFRRTLRGFFKSYKNNCEIHFESSYELNAYLKLEHDDNVIQYGRCNFSIPYFYKGEMCNYVPDIGVEYIDGNKIIIEVKPKSLISITKNVIKHNALQNYCNENNMKGIYWTEKDIFNV